MKTKCLMYCTKALPNLHRLDENEFYNDRDTHYNGLALNGKIVAECDCDKVEEIVYNGWWNCYANNDSIESDNFDNDFACLSVEEMKKYLGDKNGYALHISNLKIFDKPLSLSECEKDFKGNPASHYWVERVCDNWVDDNWSDLFFVQRAPQNMMWVWYKGERYALISIRPQHLCNILNRRKTIEVRKKILKGM